MSLQKNLPGERWKKSIRSVIKKWRGWLGKERKNRWRLWKKVEWKSEKSEGNKKLIWKKGQKERRRNSDTPERTEDAGGYLLTEQDETLNQPMECFEELIILTDGSKTVVSCMDVERGRWKFSLQKTTLKKKIKAVIRSIRKGKIPRVDGKTVQMLKIAGDLVADWMHKICKC